MPVFIRPGALVAKPCAAQWERPVSVKRHAPLRHSGPASHAVGVANSKFGELMKAWDQLLYLAIPITLMIGLAIVNELGGSQMAQFFDHLAISGIVAGVIVFLFF